MVPDKESPPVHKNPLVPPNSTPEEGADKNCEYSRRHRGGQDGDLNELPGSPFEV